MNKLTIDDLDSLETYQEKRPAMRAAVMEHKKKRRVALGPNATLHFEDRMTMRYQVQEMLRAERIFERQGIEEELETYNALIPDGRNWKATLMIEFGDEAERRDALQALVGFESRVWMRAGDLPPIHPIADEDLERSTGTKTSAVHFLRFEPDDAMIAAIHGGAPIRIGCDHPHYRHEVVLDEQQRASLAGDLRITVN